MRCVFFFITDADMLQNSKLACLLHHRQVKEKHAVERAVVSFRHQYQQPCSRREHDLNDPDRCRKAEPGDVQMMLSGLVGEDPDSQSRRQRQKEQFREWLIQQQSERAAEKHQQKLESRSNTTGLFSYLYRRASSASRSTGKTFVILD